MSTRADLEQILITLETQDLSGQIEVMCNAALERNGGFAALHPENSWGNQMAEVRAYGIYGQGMTAMAAIQSWRRCAARRITTLQALECAEQLIRQNASTTSTELRQACDLILSERGKAGSRIIAREILKALDAAASTTPIPLQLPQPRSL
jgi:hypothetical protein